MATGTEIYICKKGQKLEDGRMEFVPERMDRNRAQLDARERMDRDESIAKIGYYAVDDEGNFKPIHTAESPMVNDASKPAQKAKQSNGASAGRRSSGAASAGTKGRKPKRSLMARLLDLVTEEAR